MKYNTFLIAILLSIFFAFHISSCSESETDNHIEQHPQDKNIPYSDREHVLVDTSNNTIDINRHDKIHKLRNYLAGSKNFESKNLVDVSGIEDLHVLRFDKERIAILDSDAQEFFEYNHDQDSVFNIAEFGRGPGGIAHSADITTYDKDIFIPMSSGRISSFDCNNSPCTFREELKINELIIYSMAKTDSSFVSLGSAPVNQNTVDKERTKKALHVYNSSVEKLHEFGNTYETNEKWMLERPFIDGAIRYNRAEELYILAFERFPFIYAFDKNFELTNSFKLENFIIGKQEYWPKEGRLNIVLDDHSLIEDITLLTEGFALVKVLTKTNRVEKDAVFRWDRKLDFYLLDMNNERSTYIGSKSYNKEKAPANVHFTMNGLMHNRNGVLNWIEF